MHLAFLVDWIWESQGTLCQRSCFSPHSLGSHGTLQLSDLFVCLSHVAWNGEQRAWLAISKNSLTDPINPGPLRPKRRALSEVTQQCSNTVMLL